MLKFKVSNQTLTRTDSFVPVADSRNYLTAEFEFSDEWTGGIAAVFTRDGKPQQVLLTDGKCTVPCEVIKAPGFYVSAFCGDLITADDVYIKVKAAGITDNDGAVVPTPSVWDDYIKQLAEENSELLDEKLGGAVDEAKAYADSAADTAEGNAKAYADSKAQAAESAAKQYTDSKTDAALTAAKSYADSKAQAAESAAKSYADTKASTADFDELKNKVAKISEDQTTKNLFDSDILLGITDCAKVGGEYSFTAANAKKFGTVFSDFEPDKIYTLSFMAKVSQNSSTGNGLVFRFEYTDAKRSAVAIPNATTEWTKFSLSSDGRTISALVPDYNNGGANVWWLKEIQLEVGKNATEYVPYGGITAVDKTAREEIAKSLKSGEITVSDTSQYSSFDELPVNTIVNILPSVKLTNAPDGYQYVGHNISDTGKYNATVLTYSAYKTVTDGVVQMCIFYNADYELSKQPRMAVRYGIKKDETIEWSDWSTMSNDSCLHSSNRVVDVNSYSEFTFDDFNDAPVNAIYQVDLNCADVIKNNPSPGHSGLLITYAFSPISRHALVQHHYALENGNIAMYIRYSYKNAPNDFRWTQWKNVAAIDYVKEQLSTKADRYAINNSVTGNTLLLADKSDTQLLSAASTALTLTLPETITSEYECFFSFKSGATATSITAPSGIVWTGADCNSNKEFVPLANTVYEVGIRCIGFDSDDAPYISAKVGAC